ncbi:unnamed protein product [Rhodiola kirilowii]
MSSVCVESLMPLYTVTVTSLLNSMLSVNRSLKGPDCGKETLLEQAPESNPNPNPTSDSAYQSSKSAASGKELEIPTEKPKKAPRTRPKLTPESLLSNDGLGYVLRHFPRSFKYRGRGHEVSDLGNLIGMYEEWHSHLLPYYSFEQFVHNCVKVVLCRRINEGGKQGRLRDYYENNY